MLNILLKQSGSLKLSNFFFVGLILLWLIPAHIQTYTLIPKVSNPQNLAEYISLRLWKLSLIDSI